MIPAVAAWSLNHWATREVLKHVFLCFFFRFTLFIIWLCWVFITVCGLSLVTVSGSYSFAVCGLLVRVASLVAKHRL